MRKTKPRSLHTSHHPLHNVTPAPRALVRPATALRLASSAPPSDEISPSVARNNHEQHVTRSPAAPTAQKPRKRFRKKVNGLFGDQTDLKKRMSKLLRDTDTSTLLRVADSTANDLNHFRQQPETLPSATAILPSADVVVQKLTEATMRDRASAVAHGLRDTTERTSNALHDEANLDPDNNFDSFDSPEFVATASRALGSPERLRAVRETMGRLSPRSNERFIEQVQLGSTPTPSREEDTDDVAMEESVEKIQPPELPSVDSSELETEEREARLAMSPVSVERTAAPAVLRRKVRRLDRGYRSADVLRARLQGTSVAEIAASPTSRRRGETASKWRSRIRKLVLNQDDDIDRGRSTKRQRSEHTLEDSQEPESGGMSSDETPPKKRRLRTDSTADEPNGTEDSYNVSDPLAMLVDAAAAEEQKQRSIRNRAKQPHADPRREPSDADDRRPSGERRRKRKSNPASRHRATIPE